MIDNIDYMNIIHTLAEASVPEQSGIMLIPHQSLTNTNS